MVNFQRNIMPKFFCENRGIEAKHALFQETSAFPKLRDNVCYAEFGITDAMVL